MFFALSHTIHSSHPNSDLNHGFALSARNGFGPCHTPPQQVDGEDVNISYSRELYDLCCSLTPVEEAAIRPITPLISIIKLNNGGIGSKGNTSCVWQQSKLNTILPNLPSQCNYIIVTRRIARNSANTNSNSGMSSTRFNRAKIQRVLELLKLTNHPAWKDILISPENLLAWPEDGDIAIDFPMIVVTESEDGQVIDSEGTVLGNLNVNIDSARLNDDTGDIDDGQQTAVVNDFGSGNTGPAPLQNDVIPDETFEGVVNVVDRTETGGGNANMLNAHVRDFVSQLRSNVLTGTVQQDHTLEQQIIADHDVQGSTIHQQNHQQHIDTNVADFIMPVEHGGYDEAPPTMPIELPQPPPHYQPPLAQPLLPQPSLLHHPLPQPPLPQPRFNADQTEATFDHGELLPVNGFVNMNSQPYAWSLAFPTLFIPTYVKVGDHMEWKIFHDITGWEGPREKPVKKNQWHEHLMWRSDGRPAAHPTFSLVLYNAKVKNYLQRQGQYLINTTDFDAGVTIEAIRRANDDDAVLAQTTKLLERAIVYSGNSPGTPEYWKATYHEFVAANFLRSYLFGEDINMFITGSLAEFHEYPLRLLLSKYISALSPQPTDLDPVAILTNDAMFNTAVQRYKTIVTNYQASKMEIWNAHFLHPVYGVVGGNSSIEYAPGRGAQHNHNPSHSSSPALKQISQILKVFSLAIHHAMKPVQQYIRCVYKKRQHEPLGFTSDPSTVYSKDAPAIREKFCKLTAVGKQLWEHYQSSVTAANNTCSEEVAAVLETYFGLHAMHTGNFPEDWVMPGGPPHDVHGSNYRLTEQGMQTTQTVLDAKELKCTKSSRERELHQRHVNIQNHCGCHKCSNYCWKEISCVRTYDETLHSDVTPDNRFSRDGIDYVTIKRYECRMDFGRKLKFDSSPENNLTQGQERQVKGKIVADKNGHAKFVAVRNHPRTLQQPYGFPWFGANNDIKFLLLNNCGEELLESLGPEEYEEYSNNLVAAGWGGLEHYNGAHIIERYVTGYQCKGETNSQSWNDTAQTVIENYCSRDVNQNRTVRSLMAHSMSEITRGQSITRDQSAFMLTGGRLKRSSFGTPMKCSVNKIPLEDIASNEIRIGDDGGGGGGGGGGVGIGGGGDEGGAADVSSSFQWPNIMKRYKSRDPDHENLNLYTWCALHWKKDKLHVPQFFGYSDYPTWPLTEEYSKWKLTFFKPWRNSVEEVKSGHESFRESLKMYYFDKQFPPRIRTEILRVKRNESSVDLTASNLGGGEMEFTPTNSYLRRNEASEEAEEAANMAHAAAQESGGGEEDEVDMDDALYVSLVRHASANYNWSDHYYESKTKALEAYAKAYYQKRTAVILEHSDNEPVKLFDIDNYHPRKAKSEEQKFLMHHHLYTQYVLKKYRENQGSGEPSELPPMQSVYIEGLPGVGKTHCILTIQNMTRVINNTNTADMSSAPTGCAASLIHASTNCRVGYIPTGDKFYKAPSNALMSNHEELMASRKSYCSVITRIIDEHSMMGRPDYAWYKHRNEELRRPMNVLDAEGEGITVHHDSVLLHQEIYSRPHGGIPIQMFFGDTNQLPPVMKKPAYSQESTKPGTADALGQVAFSEILDPPDTNVMESVIVSMKHVLRQDDPPFLDLLSAMRNGTVTRDQADLLVDRCLDKLSTEEKDDFNKNALSLVPTWKQANLINHKYLLHTMTTPIAKITGNLNSVRDDGKNCCVRDSKLPMKNALCVGAKVMLLKNFLVEYHLMNGSVGTVTHLCYLHCDGPNHNSENDLQYAIVDFPQSTIPEEDKFFPDLPRTCVPIPVVKEMCEKKCCSIFALPLRCCAALSIHKSQGMTVGPNQPFEKVIIYYPVEPGRQNTPGLELVATSRAMSIQCFAVGNPVHELTYKYIQSIGNTPAYGKRKLFLADIEQKSLQSQQPTKDRIKALDPSTDTDKTYEGGSDFLLNWYDTLCLQHTSQNN